MAQSATDASCSASSSSCPIPVKEKPIVVRVKRKLNQTRLDAFWLEINVRPSKRPLLDFDKLSITSLNGGKVIEEENSKKKLLVQHMETVTHSESIENVLQSFLSDSTGSKEIKSKIEERKSSFKQSKKLDQLRSVARQKHENLARNARFEQIWKSRKGGNESNEDSLREICHLYDIVQLDDQVEKSGTVQKQGYSSIEEDAILCNYLPLIREYIPSAAQEIETDILSRLSSEDNYVFDLYTVESNCDNKMDEDIATDYPLVRVDEEEDYYDGPSHSEYETDDSNAEDNPLNDYPDEESSHDENEYDIDPFDDLENDSDSQEYEKEVVDFEIDDEVFEYYKSGHS